MGQGWGRGRYDSENDVWQWYAFPPGHPELTGTPTGFSWTQIVEQWRWIRSDFALFYPLVNLAAALEGGHRQFDSYITGLLHSESSLLRKALMPRK